MTLVISKNEGIRLFMALPDNWYNADKRLAVKIAMSSINPFEIAHALYVAGMRQDSDIETVLRAKFGCKFAVSCYFGTIIEL